MQDFQLFDQHLNNIPLIEGFPKKYLGSHGIPASLKCHAYYGKLPMLFQAIKVGSYEAVISDYLTNESEKITCKAYVECIELHFLISGKVQFQLEGFNWVGLENSYNMIALTKVKNQVLFKATPISTFDIHISKAKLIELAKRFSRLKLLITALNEKKYESLFDRPQKISIQMLQLIYRIKEAIFAGDADSVSTIQMIEELIVLVLDNSSIRTKYRYSFEDVTRLNKAHRLIAKYLDEKDILSRKIIESRIKSDKFREGFKIIFDALPSKYLTSRRLELAKKLAEGGSITKITDIAQMCGYDSAKHLSKAFYKYFEIKLSDILKENRKKKNNK